MHTKDEREIRYQAIKLKEERIQAVDEVVENAVVHGDSYETLLKRIGLLRLAVKEYIALLKPLLEEYRIEDLTEEKAKELDEIAQLARTVK